MKEAHWKRLANSKEKENDYPEKIAAWEEGKDAFRREREQDSPNPNKTPNCPPKTTRGERKRTTLGSGHFAMLPGLRGLGGKKRGF